MATTNYGKNAETTQGAVNLGLGLGGWDYISDTSEHTGDWVAIQAIGGEATIDTLEATNRDSLSSVKLTQDATIVGPIYSIKLSSGAVLAYKRV